MTLLAVGNAIEAVLDAVRAHLRSDSVLQTLVSARVYEQLPEAAEVTFPYVRLAGPNLDNQAFGAMGKSGGRLIFSVDAWSEAKGPHEVRQVMATIKALLERTDLVIAGHRLVAGSITAIEDRDFDEPDADMPERRLWHGHQTWSALIEEA